MYSLIMCPLSLIPGRIFLDSTNLVITHNLTADSTIIKPTTDDHILYITVKAGYERLSNRNRALASHDFYNFTINSDSLPSLLT